MNALRRHLLAGPEHDELAHHPDCPQCRERRLGVAPPADLGGRRAAAVLVTAATLLGTANGGVAFAQGYKVNAPTTEAASGDPADGPDEPDDADVDNSDDDAPAPAPRAASAPSARSGAAGRRRAGAAHGHAGARGRPGGDTGARGPACGDAGAGRGGPRRPGGDRDA